MIPISQSKKLSPRAMWSLAVLLSVSLVATIAASPSLAGSVRLDHQGDGRCFDVLQSGNGSTDIVSRGDGGCLEADIHGTGQSTIFMLGDGVNGQVHAEGFYGSVYMGMCPPGMKLEPVMRSHSTIGAHIPRCI